MTNKYVTLGKKCVNVMSDKYGSWHMFIKQSYFVITQWEPTLPPWASTHMDPDSPIALKGGVKTTLFQSFHCPDPYNHGASNSVEGVLLPPSVGGLRVESPQPAVGGGRV